MFWLILSTLPHYVSILPVLSFYKTYTSGYVHIIGISTTLSIFYHLVDESEPAITFLDYFAAYIWFLFDLKYAYHLNIMKIVWLNSLIFYMNQSIPNNEDYEFFHSLWHLFSAGKCYYVSTLISEKLVDI